MAYIEAGTTEYKKASIALFIGGFVIFSVVYTTQPLMPVFTKEFQVSAAEASLSLSLTTGILAFVMMIAASLSEKIGKKKIMMTSLLLTSLLGILTAFSPNFLTLLFFRAMLGVTCAGLPSIAMAYVGEEFQPNGIGKIMGLHIAGNSLGGLSGRMITGAVTDLISWRFALGMIGLIALVLTIIFWRILPDPKNSVPKPNKKVTFTEFLNVLKNTRLMALISVAFLFMGSFVTLFNYIGFLLVSPPYNLNQTVIGSIFLVYLFGTFSSVYMGRKADRIGNFPMIILSVTITIAGAVITLLPSVIMKVAGLSIFTFGFFASHSIASAWVGQTSGIRKAQATSLYLLFYYLGSSVIGTVGGYFWTTFDWIGVIILVSGLLFLSVPLILYAHKKEVTLLKTSLHNRHLE